MLPGNTKKMINDKIGVILLSIYKVIINFARLALGIAIVVFSFSYTGFILANKNLIQRNNIVYAIARHIDFPSPGLAKILAFSLIILSLVELVFLIALILRKKWGAIGLFIMAIAWIPIELLFISKFLIVSRIISLAINLIIIFFLYRLITKSKYFKSHPK